MVFIQVDNDKRHYVPWSDHSLSTYTVIVPAPTCLVQVVEHLPQNFNLKRWPTLRRAVLGVEYADVLSASRTEFGDSLPVARSNRNAR